MNASFGVFLVGYLVVIAGVAYGMSAAGIGTPWIITVVLVLAGIGIIGSLSRAQRGDGAPESTEPTSAPPQH
ncbi:MAG: hypothetical protein R3247_00560 [Rhodothermales bacterium]|nr:hypothetical protein [Rhodothermales bacterium]